MSHFVLTVCMNEPEDGNVGEALTKLLAPYDENIEVPEYREYEEGEAGEYWLLSSLKRSAEEVANNDRSSVKPYRPNEFGYSSAYDTRYTEEQQWENIQKEAEDYAAFSKTPTWPEIIEYTNHRWYPEGETDENHRDYLHYDADEDRAFKWTTYNPLSKWDWYQVGGRWSDYFATRSDLTVEQAQRLIRGDRSWVSAPRKMEKQNWVDGGPKGLLDFQYMRSRKEFEAESLWKEFHSITDELPHASTWSYVKDRLFPEDIQAAREFYNAQPRIEALRDNKNFYTFFGPCLIEKYGNDPYDMDLLDDLMAKAAQEAVPGFSLLTLEGEWVEPGKMGWFGASTDTPEERDEFKTFANKYLDSLADDVLVISVDLHI